jgi:D-xylose transport system ATP-binding protein
MPLIEMLDIIKDFPGVRALDGVNIALESGEIHALVGENGAGKSTLMKILSGVYPAGSFEGEIIVDNSSTRFRGISESESAGIAMIFQELSLVKEMSVGENIFLGREPSKFGVIDWSRVYHATSQLLQDLHLSIDSRAKVGTLGIGQQQLVEIAKALSQNARILVLDEPTAALTESEVDILFTILRKLKERGVGMIYISHKLDEVLEIADTVTVLRDGKTVWTRPAAEIDKKVVISAMVGREVGDIFPPREHNLGDVALTVRDAVAFSPDSPDKRLVNNVSFSVRTGEVLGIAGLMGAGRTELLMTIFAAWPGNYSRRIEINGSEVKINSPADAIANGIAFVTEDRKRYGVILDHTILDNLTLAGLRRISGQFLRSRARESMAAQGPMRVLKIKAGSPLTVTGTLSGGNQQKVVLGKWLLTDPKVLFLDEPTRGIDVGAKQEIYVEINKLAKAGLAIVLVSSELPEVLGLSDRVLVLHEGQIKGEFTRAEATPEKVMAAATS